MFRHGRELVALTDGERGKRLRVDCFDRAAGIERAPKHLEGTFPENIGEISQMHPEPAVWLVASELVHRLRVRYSRERRYDFHVAARAKKGREHAFHERKNFVRGYERRLYVDLGKFGLPIGAEIFVPETFRDLEIFLEPADHQELLVLLRRLGKRVELPLRQPARDQEIAGPFRGALRQNGGLDLDEPFLVQVIPRRFRDPVA